MNGGMVYLIGAGPGDPELVTLKAARALARCDVVLVDDLVHRDALRQTDEDTGARTELIQVKTGQ